jgi:hypothetical protein
MDIIDWIMEIIITYIIVNGSKGKIPNGWDIARFVAWAQDFDGCTKDERISLFKEFLRKTPII